MINNELTYVEEVLKDKELGFTLLKGLFCVYIKQDILVISEIAGDALEEHVTSWISLACENILRCIENLLSMTSAQDVSG
jgi:hypothetical protein